MKYLPLFCAIFSMGCITHNLNTSNKYVPCNCHDSITVYGNEHLIPLAIIPLDKQDAIYKKRVTEVQKWLYGEVNEDIVIGEGFAFKDEPYDTAWLYSTSKAITLNQKNILKEFALSYSMELRLIVEGQKQVYGGENDSVLNLIIDSLKVNLLFTESAECERLMYLRNEAILKSAELFCSKNKKRIAIILGRNHLIWFKERGYAVKYPPGIN